MYSEQLENIISVHDHFLKILYKQDYRKQQYISVKNEPSSIACIVNENKIVCINKLTI